MNRLYFTGHRGKVTSIPFVPISTQQTSRATIRAMNRLTRTHALAFMVFCLLVAAALRLPDLPNAPPGLHYDEAANGLLSADIGLGGELPIFISSYTGKEVLFFYLAGTMMRLIGASVFSLRLDSRLRRNIDSSGHLLARARNAGRPPSGYPGCGPTGGQFLARAL